MFSPMTSIVPSKYVSFYLQICHWCHCRRKSEPSYLLKIAQSKAKIYTVNSKFLLPEFTVGGTLVVIQTPSYSP